MQPPPRPESESCRAPWGRRAGPVRSCLPSRKSPSQTSTHPRVPWWATWGVLDSNSHFGCNLLAHLKFLLIFSFISNTYGFSCRNLDITWETMVPLANFVCPLNPSPEMSLLRLVELDLYIYRSIRLRERQKAVFFFLFNLKWYYSFSNI